MRKEDLKTLSQIIGAIELSLDSLEKAYNKNDTPNLEKAKKEILNFQEKFSEELNG